MDQDRIQGEPLRILLVEDNADHAELVRRVLDDNGIGNVMDHVSDGEAALDYLFRRGQFAGQSDRPQPHLILLDLRLPRIDGLEVLDEVKSDDELRQIPVVVLTTSEAGPDIARAYSCHANSYLVKPVDFAKFNRMIRDLGFYWLGWNRFPWD
jgi:CheY-like chemotaxis protein